MMLSILTKHINLGAKFAEMRACISLFSKSGEVTCESISKKLKFFMRVGGLKFVKSWYLIGLIYEMYLAKLDRIKTDARNQASRHSI